MEAQGIQPPAAGDLSARLAHKVHSQARRKQLFQRTLSGEQFSLSGGFFVNDNGTATTILQKMIPNACGIILLDKPVAEDIILNLKHRPHDELAVLCLGHECPHPSSCSQTLRFPAMASGSDGQVLLAGCLRNLGGRAVSTAVKDGPPIDLSALVQCSFHAYQDDWHESPSWSEVTASPVKVLIDQFKQGGVSLQPWARSFRLKGRSAVPSTCDAVQFNAMIPKNALPQVLKASGHQGVYVVPRDNKGQLLAGWSVVWLPGSKADIARVALSVVEQAGTVRSRGKFGLRVPDADFEGLHKRLRPDQMLRPKVSVQFLFKVAPLPVGTTEESLVKWASGLSWTVRVLKALGPHQWLLGAETPLLVVGSPLKEMRFSLSRCSGVRLSAMLCRLVINTCRSLVPHLSPRRLLLACRTPGKQRMHGLPTISG